MDTLTILLVIVGLAAFAGLVYLAGYELGQADGVTTERESANRRINGVLDSINTRRPKAAKNRRKAQRKAVRA
jgi:hypothetical protein